MQSVLAKKTPIQVAYVVREPFRWQRVHLSRLFFRCDATTRAMTLLHECAHVANDALDHAYLWDASFGALTPAETLENADSIALLIFAAASIVDPFPPGADPLPALQLPMGRRRRLVDAALERPGFHQASCSRPTPLASQGHVQLAKGAGLEARGGVER